MSLTPAQRAHFDQLKSSGQLPSPKGPALAVVKLTRQDNVSFAQLAQAVKADPSLVARLLKLANGCRAPGSRPIVAIQDSVSVLGLTVVRGLALGFSLLNDSRTGKCRHFDYTAFWSRNLARAVAMQAVAGITRAMPGDESFTLGLLAHIGELGLASAFPEAYAELLENGPANINDLLLQERQSFELDHADFTAVLLEDWGIPPALIEPVRWHEKPEAANFIAGSRSERIFLGLMLASHIADICLAPENQRRVLMAELFLLGGKLSISPEILTDLCDTMVRDWGDWCRLLDVPAQTLPPFAELMKSSQLTPHGDFNGLPTASEGERFRVLIVDDVSLMRSLLKALLAHIGHECLEAENGRQGLDLALKERPHLMIVDWDMPVMNGIELIRALRETEIGRNIYILILTGMNEEKHLVEAFEAGADDFLTKPLNAKVLAARLRAGQRVVTLHRDIEHDQTNLKRFATEFSALNQRLQETRATDSLTGLLARVPALEWMRQTFGSSNGTEPVGAILIQLEGLDEINRTSGRQVGDEVVSRVAALVQTLVGPQEKLSRYSGSRFLLVCPGATKDDVGRLAIKIKQAIATQAFTIGEQLVHVAASVGFALGHALASEIDVLLNEAEFALAETHAHDFGKSSTLKMMATQKHGPGDA